MRSAVRTRGLFGGRPFLRYALRRVGYGVLTLWIVSVLIFAGTQLLPGDAAKTMLGRGATPEALEALRQRLRLDESAVTQYWHWLSGILRGDLGSSAIGASSGQPVSVISLISGPLSNSLALAAATVAVMVPIGMLLGVASAIWRGSRKDHFISAVSLAAVSLPEFVTGALLISIFAIRFDLLPATSLLGPGQNPLSQPEVLVLPVLTLLAVTLAQIVRMVRASTIEALRSDYVMSARLAGIAEGRVVFHYALRNALAPSIQVIALNIQFLIGGIVVTETVFGYPGIGLALNNAVGLRDIPTVQGIAIIIAALYIGLNIVADLLVALAVPKLRTSM